VNSKIIYLIVFAVVFGVAWYAGWLVRLKTYWDETMSEMKRCTWPTWDELKGSTVVIFICMAILGAFTFVVDVAFSKVLSLIN
jgi:preprotein translocase subunit SecE